MINTIKYLEFKRLLLKHYRNTRVCIELRGAVNSRMFIENTRITINKNKLIISNNEKDFTIEFMMMKKIKLAEKYHIELIYQDFGITLEI